MLKLLNLNAYWPSTPLAIRRLKLTVVAFTLIVLSLITFYLVGLLPHLLPALAEIINDKNGLYVRLTNALLSLMCAAFLLWPAKGGKLVGGWNVYVGAAFFTFFVQYSLRSSLSAAIVWNGNATDVAIRVLTFVVELIIFAGSTLNNFFLLTASKILLNKKNRLKVVPPPPDNAGNLQRVEHKIRVSLPSWAWIPFLFSLLGSLPDVIPLPPALLWVRFPDAIFSIYCLSWFGYALYLSLYVRRGRRLARVTLVLVLAYGAGQLVYAGNPVIAYALRPDSSAKWLHRIFPFAETIANENSKEPKTTKNGAAIKADPPVSETIASDDSKQAETTKNGAKADPPEVKLAKTLDGALFAVLIPMKYLLFLPAFILYLLSIISVNDFRQALQRTTSKRQDYLSQDGILSVIGNSLDANEVRLLVRIPGVKRLGEQTEERVLEETWDTLSISDEEIEPLVYPIKVDPLLERAMQTEGEIIVISSEDGEEAEALGVMGPIPQTLTLIPIKFHGGIIGVLRVIFSGYGKYNEGTLEQLKFMAELIAPSVQDFRTVSAVDKLGIRFDRVQLEKPTDSFKHATEGMIENLFDLLNPLGIGLDIQWGFTSSRPIFAKDPIFHKVLEIQKVPRAEKKPAPVDTSEGPICVEIDQLLGRTERGERYQIGTLMLAIPKEKDDFAQPTLAAYYLTRRMVASLTANGISNAARNALGVVIEDLALALNKETLSVAEWFGKIDFAIKKSGLLWVVASLDNGASFHGDEQHQQIISSLSHSEKEALLARPLTWVSLSPGLQPPNIIHLQLEKPEHRLFLGVKREKFGIELLESPWRDFLEKLADVAGVALASIEDRQNTEARRRKEADERLRTAQDEWLQTIAVINAMLMHQLVNMVRNQLDAAGHLLEILPKDSCAQDGQFLTSLTAIKESAEMMQNLTKACTNITSTAKHSSCSIQEAAEQAEGLFQFALKKKEISVNTDIPAGTTVRVQSNVVALALASLIGNAIDAIKARGSIKITAEVKGDVVLCHVINTGTCIPDEIRKKLFQPGITDKNEHNGWGLYLVSRSLSKFNGTIFLDYSNSDETCFTLHLPNSSD